jgi:inner membrane protein
MEFIVPTIITHSLVGAAAAAVAAPRDHPRRFWLLALACPVLPDADVIAFRLGIPYGAFCGHRGFAHSLVLAALLGLAAAWVMAIAPRETGAKVGAGAVFSSFSR